VAYRDEQQALWIQVAELERENDQLREALERAAKRYRSWREEQHAQRKDGARKDCIMCGGTLLPVAVFAGHDTRSPIPLSMSTLRFGLPDGGFTHSAPVRFMACSSCGFIHNFIDIEHAISVPDEGEDGGAEEETTSEVGDSADDGAGTTTDE
jgi:hypothetical protein